MVGFAAGEIPKLPLNLVLLKSCDIRGVLWGAWALREPDGQRALMTDIVRWCAEGKLSAHVHAAYPLAEIATALKPSPTARSWAKSCCGRNRRLPAHARKRALRRFTMVGRDVRRYEFDRGRKHRGIVGVADHRQHVGNEVGGEHEIGERANERGLHMDRRLAIERAIMGGDQIFRERQPRRKPTQLLPEIAPQSGFVSGNTARQRFDIRP